MLPRLRRGRAGTCRDGQMSLRNVDPSAVAAQNSGSRALLQQVSFRTIQQVELSMAVDAAAGVAIVCSTPSYVYLNDSDTGRPLRTVVKSGATRNIRVLWSAADSSVWISMDGSPHAYRLDMAAIAADPSKIDLAIHLEKIALLVPGMAPIVTEISVPQAATTEIPTTATIPLLLTPAFSLPSAHKSRTPSANRG